MTDVELSSLLIDLQNTANRLNSETTGVNSLIQQVETRLQVMNLGLECWLERDILASEIERPNVSLDVELGFAKVAGEWCLAVRVVRYQYDKGRDRWDVADYVGAPTKLQDASRDIRIAALKRIPRLLESLKKRAEEDTQTIQEAKKLLGW